MNEHDHRRPGSSGPGPSRSPRRSFDADRTLRQVRWVELAPWISLVPVALVWVAALATGAWRPVIVLTVFLLPKRIGKIIDRREELRALATAEDYLGALQRRVERQLSDERTSLLLGLGAAAAFLLLSQAGHRGAAACAVVGVLVLVWSVARFAVLAPRLARELEDLGGSESGGWTTAVIVVAFVIAAPFLILYGVLRRAVRRMRGLPEEPEEKDS